MSAADAAFPPPGCFRYGRRDNADHGTAEMGRAECTSSSSPSSCPIRPSAPRRRPARARPDRNAASTRPPRHQSPQATVRGRPSPAAGLDFLPDLSGTCTRRLLRIRGVLGGSGAALQPGLPARRRGAHDACWSAPGLRTASSAVRCILRKATLAMTERARRLLWFVALWCGGVAALALVSTVLRSFFF